MASACRFEAVARGQSSDVADNLACGNMLEAPYGCISQPHARSKQGRIFSDNEWPILFWGRCLHCRRHANCSTRLQLINTVCVCAPVRLLRRQLIVVDAFNTLQQLMN